MRSASPIETELTVVQSSPSSYCYPFSSMISLGVQGSTSNDEGKERERAVPMSNGVESSQAEPSGMLRITTTTSHNPNPLARYITLHHIKSHYI